MLNAGSAWVVAKEWLKNRGYGDMYADSLKFVQKEESLWHITAKFTYMLTEDKQADIWIDDETREVVRYKVEP